MSAFLQKGEYLVAFDGRETEALECLEKAIDTHPQLVDAIRRKRICLERLHGPGSLSRMRKCDDRTFKFNRKCAQAY